MKNLFVSLVIFLCLYSLSYSASDSLLAYWSFDDGTARDVTGNGYDGVKVNNPTVILGVAGNALHFQGKGYYMLANDNPANIGDHILLPPIDLHGLKEFTISMWVKHENFSNWAGEGYFWLGHHTYGWLGIINTPDPPYYTHYPYYLQFSVGGYNVDRNMIKVRFEDNYTNNWICCSMVYSDGKLIAYINGVKVSETTMEVNYKLNLSAIARHWWFYEGEERTSARFTGAIDEVKIFKKALTEEEIRNECLSCGTIGFEYNSFANALDLQLVGNARILKDVVRLTSSVQNQSGALWTKSAVPVSYGFETNFKFRFTNGINNQHEELHYPGADGIAFVIQNTSNQIIGANGGGIGYDGIPNSLAIEFDTYANDSTQIENFNDPNDNHIAVLSNGVAPNSSKHIQPYLKGTATNIVPLKTDGTIFYSKIIYNNNNKTLAVWLDTTEQLGTPCLTISNIDLPTLLNLEQGKEAYIGFTSATGNAYETHDILYWSFCPYSYLLSVEPGEPLNRVNTLPNPANTLTKILFESSKDLFGEVKIYDILGNEILSKKVLVNIGSNEIEIDCSNLTSGVYFYKISLDNEVLNGKFLVVK